MSQYPPPSPPPQQPYFGYPPPRPPSPEELLAPARRAGILMIVTGVLCVACGLCTAYQARNFDPGAANLPPEVARQMEQQMTLFETQTGMSFQKAMAAVGIVPLAVGAVIGGMGFFVRGGSFGWIIAASVLVGMLLLGAGLILLIGLIQGLSAGPAFALAATCVYGVPFLLLALLLVWLIQAARASSRVALAKQQYQAQVWHYQQYQQAYLQQSPQAQQPSSTGMGYHNPAPPPAPPPAAPPPPAPPDQKDPPDAPPAQG